MTNRRHVLQTLATGALLAAPTLLLHSLARAAKDYAVTHTDDEWRKLLTPAQYRVLRQAGTERPFSSPLDHEKRAGVFACAGCQLTLFSSSAKFDSRTGWPSF